MKVTINEKHLKKAIRQTPKARQVGRACLVAQAAKEVYGKDFRSCGCYWMFFTKNRAVRLPKSTASLVEKFDKAADDYKAIEASLPLIVHFPDLPQ